MSTRAQPIWGRSPARRAALWFALLAALGVAALVLAGASDQRRTAFSVGVPAAYPIATLEPGRRLCQGPFQAPAGFASVQLFFQEPAGPGTRLRVSAVSPSGSALAGGTLSVRSVGAASPNVGLSRTVPPGSPLSVCIDNAGSEAVTLLGAPAQSGSGVLTSGGRSLKAATAMVMLSPRSRSLLSSLPTVFRRAALFRPSWFGAWTFWLLLVALAAAFPLGALAVGLATREDSAQATTPGLGAGGAPDEPA